MQVDSVQCNSLFQAMYGAMTAFAGCDAFAELREHKPEMAKWFDQMCTLVETHAGANEFAQRLEARHRSIGNS